MKNNSFNKEAQKFFYNTPIHHKKLKNYVSPYPHISDIIFFSI